MKNYTYFIFTCLLIFGCLVGCKKDFLDVKPNKAILIPETLDDLQALLDNITILNNKPSLGIIASDEFQLVENGHLRLTAVERGIYLWQPDPYQGEAVLDWIYPYQHVFYANVVLDGLENIQPVPANQGKWNMIKGAALFYRSFAFFNLAQEFCRPYNPRTVETDLGIPLPLSSDVNVRPGRGKLSEVYQRVIEDLTGALNLLPEKGATKNRPGRQTVFALLSRLFLIVGDYESALYNANEALKISSDLIDYNTITAGVTNSFFDILSNKNQELIYYAPRLGTSFFIPSIIKLDPTLAELYKDGDLRKDIYFYDMGNDLIYNTNYDGLATDELYLIRAECKIRLGKINEGINDVNTLLVKRYIPSHFIPLAATTEEDALKIIINERRKELVGRNLRWQDLRRFNLDARFAKILHRTYNGENFVLLPNSEGYVFPIPDDEIRNGKIEQN